MELIVAVVIIAIVVSQPWFWPLVGTVIGWVVVLAVGGGATWAAYKVISVVAKVVLDAVQHSPAYQQKQAERAYRSSGVSIGRSAQDALKNFAEFADKRVDRAREDMERGR